MGGYCVLAVCRGRRGWWQLVGGRMKEVELLVALKLDKVANAASIVFDATAHGRDLRTYPVHDSSGAIIATVTFTSAGTLVDLELLDAAQQLIRVLE